jgi:hypothetical protein
VNIKDLKKKVVNIKKYQSPEKWITAQGFFFLVWEKIPVGSEKSGFQKYQKYRPKYW